VRPRHDATVRPAFVRTAPRQGTIEGTTLDSAPLKRIPNAHCITEGALIMICDIRTRGLKRQQRLLRRAMRKLKRWGEEPADADSDIAPLLECYQYTRDKGNGIPDLLYRRIA
jgi:hypothetical protein